MTVEVESLEIPKSIAASTTCTRCANCSAWHDWDGGQTVLTDDGPLDIAVPRDREGTLAPRFIAKHERRFTGFDDKVLALYARGMTVREIQGFLADMCAVEVSG